jgi:hypothetical protein
VEKLLELTDTNEQFVIDYRSYLCSKAKSIEGCLTGNLALHKKTTKHNTSVAKYAKDCSALNMFCNGDDTYLTEVFYKSKTKPTDL